MPNPNDPCEWYVFSDVGQLVPPHPEGMGVSSHGFMLGTWGVTPTGPALRSMERQAVHSLREFLRREGQRGYGLTITPPLATPLNALSVSRNAV